MNIDKQYIFDKAVEIFEIPSPSGYCNKIIEYIKNEVTTLGYEFEKTIKGNGIISVEGTSDYTVGFSVHVDTLGAMVRSITSDGSIKFTSIGGPIWATLDGEYCKIHTRNDKTYTGTILSTSPAIHVYKDASKIERNPENMEIRIDEIVKSKEDVQALGIQVGDIISFEPKTTITKSEFIKSRFLDDKINVASILGLLKYFKDNNITPKYTIKIIISTYEEVGHGASFIPKGIKEMIAVDMGCIGDDLTCTEYDVSICPKDSSGPYDYDITSRFMTLAKDNKLDYAVDIYPYYGSDVSAALRGGNDIKGGLIGPGVHASHGMERTHYKAIENTIKLLYLYIT